MNVYINNTLTPLPAQVMTVEDLLNWKQIPLQGTAVAVNDKLVIKRNWQSTNLSDQDRLTIISAAFGG